MTACNSLVYDGLSHPDQVQAPNVVHIPSNTHIRVRRVHLIRRFTQGATTAPNGRTELSTTNEF